MASRSQSTAPLMPTLLPRTPLLLLPMPMLLSLPLMRMLRVTLLLRPLLNPSRLRRILTRMKPASTTKAATSAHPPRTPSSTTTAPGGHPRSSSRLLSILSFRPKKSLPSVSLQDVSPLKATMLVLIGMTAAILSCSLSSLASQPPLELKKETPCKEMRTTCTSS